MAINMTKTLKTSKGASLIELLIAIAIITTTLVSLLAVFGFSLGIAIEKKHLYQANFLAKETMEGVRNFRDNTEWNENGLGTLNTMTIYNLNKQGSPPKWTLAQGEKTINGFTQEIIFEDVYRDSNDNIIYQGGILDLDTKKVKASIIWTEKEDIEQIDLWGIFTNWR